VFPTVCPTSGLFLDEVFTSGGGRHISRVSWVGVNASAQRFSPCVPTISNRVLRSCRHLVVCCVPRLLARLFSRILVSFFNPQGQVPHFSVSHEALFLAQPLPVFRRPPFSNFFGPHHVGKNSAAAHFPCICRPFPRVFLFCYSPCWFIIFLFSPLVFFLAVIVPHAWTPEIPISTRHPKTPSLPKMDLSPTHPLLFPLDFYLQKASSPVSP